MANQITDNRTQLADADGTTDGIAGTWTGSTSVVLDTDVKIEGTGSIAEQLTNSVRTILWNRGTTINLSNTHIYIWVNCGVVGLLLSKASGGFAIRFCGPSTADFFEVYVGGNDEWPTAVAGGWVQFVVDVGAAAASPSNTGGTPPAVTAIQHIGISGVTSAMTKVADNTWVDAIYSLADNTPGIIVEGRSGGTTPWTFADIFTQLGQSAGSFRPGPGGSWVINTPLQFGINDTTTHAFADTNALLLWDNQEFAATDLYNISALGNSGGTTTVTFGVKTGSGDTASGAQGVTIAADSSGVRWAMDFDDPNIDTIGFYGCSFQHGGTFQLDDPAVEVISSLYIDCQQAVAGANSLQLKNSIIQPANETLGGGATISYINGATNGVGAANSITLTHGMTILEDDVLVAVVHADSPITSFSTSDGFTKVRADTGADTSIVEIWAKIAGASEASSYTFTATGGPDDITIVMQQFRNVYVDGGISGIWDVVPSASTIDKQTSGTTVNGPAMTTTYANSKGIFLGFSDSSTAISYGSYTGGYTNENEYTTLRPTFMTNVDLGGAGSKAAVTATASASNDMNGMQVALRSAGASSGIAFMTTDDFLDIRFCSFEYLDGHAIEITSNTVTPQENRGNLFSSGFSTTAGSFEAAIFNDSGGALTINNTNSSNLNINSYRNGTGASTTIQNSVSITITVQDTAGSPIQGAAVFLETSGGTDIISYDETNGSGQVSATYSGSTPQAVVGFVRKGTSTPVYKAAPINDTIGGAGLTATITLVPDD